MMPLPTTCFFKKTYGLRFYDLEIMTIYKEEKGKYYNTQNGNCNTQVFEALVHKESYKIK